MSGNLKMSKWLVITPKSSCFPLSTKHISFTTYEDHQGHVNRGKINWEELTCGSFTNQGITVSGDDPAVTNYGHGFLQENFVIIEI